MNEQKDVITVWVANEAGHPYHKVREKLGDDVLIKSLSLGDINPLRTDRIAWHLGNGIAKFVKETDCLLISGTPIVNALALTMWLLVHKKCRMALWDAKKREYIISTVERENLARILQRHVER